MWRGWYDIIDIEFGPVGHTHNGADAVHRIHNVMCGSYVSMTLGNFINTFEHGFRKEGSRPAACVLDVQYNWKQRYAVPGISERLAGFTKTTSNGATVSMFRIHHRPHESSGHVEVVWKRDTLDSQWRGENGEFGTHGFVLLRRLPEGAPRVVPGSKATMKKKYVAELLGNKMRQVVRDQAGSESAASAVMEWITVAAKSGQVYNRADLDELAIRDEASWGQLVNVGVPGMERNCHAIRPQAEEVFWKLPEEVEQDMQTRLLLIQGIRDAHLQLPDVRYAKNKGKTRESTSTSASSSSSSSSSSTSIGSTSSSTSSSSSSSSSSSTDTGTTSASTSASSSSYDHDNEWGAHFTECKDGAMAIQSIQWEDSKGIALVQV